MKKNTEEKMNISRKPSLHMQLVELVMERGGEVGSKLKLLELLEHYKKLDKDFDTYVGFEKSNAYQKGMLEAIKSFNKLTHKENA